MAERLRFEAESAQEPTLMKCIKRTRVEFNGGHGCAYVGRCNLLHVKAPRVTTSDSSRRLLNAHILGLEPRSMQCYFRSAFTHLF